jgi:hypothetical protein
MRGVLELCEQLLLLERRVRADTLSRLASAGILVVPSEISDAAESEGDESDDGPGGVDGGVQNKMMSMLSKSMTTAIAEPGSASAVVPIVIEPPYEFADAIRWLQIYDPQAAQAAVGERKEIIGRIALGLDMPPEQLLGLSDANHWTGWLIDDRSWTENIQPVAEMLKNDLSSSYLRPKIKTTGLDPLLFRVGYDATKVITPPDRFAVGKDAYDRMSISQETLRTLGGFTEKDKPSDEEKAERIGVAVRDGGLAITGVPTLRAGAQPETGIEAPTGDEQPEPTPAPEGPPAAGPPQTGSEAPANGGLSLARSMALFRCRELAGSRLRGKLGERAPDVANHSLPGALSARLKSIHASSAPQLVQGGAGCLLVALVTSGMEPSEAQKIAEELEAEAAGTLFDAQR